MKFKHTFNVFVDNFSIIYKQLLFRLVIGIIAGAILYAGIYPFIKNDLINSTQFNALLGGVKDFLKNLLNGNVEGLSSISQKVKDSYADFILLLQTKTTRFVLSGLLIFLVLLVEKWFAGLGNYATAAAVNDKMALRANTPFLGTLIRNLKEAAIYNAIYVPLSLLYDIIVGIALFFLVFYLLNSILPLLLCIFLFVCIIVLSFAVKMTFTSDWLPALIRGKMGQKGGLVYTFTRKGKNTLNVLSNFTVLILIIMALNVMAVFFTLGVGLLMTIPSSYVVLVCFELVNYYDRNEIKYFVDKNTIIKPAKEHTPTREEFFRGEGD